MRTVLVLLLMLPSPALAPFAAAQQESAPPEPGTTAPAVPQAEAPYPGAAQIETIPADAIVLSLDECIRAAMEANLEIAVQRYNPQSAETLVSNEEAFFDPLLTGTALRSSDQQKRVSSLIGPFRSSTDFNSYAAQWSDPLTTGGSYIINVDANDTNNTTDSDFGTTNDKGYNTDWKVTFNQALLRNFGRQANMWQIVVAQKNLGISEATFRQAVIDTVTQAVKAYADLNFAIMQLRTARFSLKLAEDFLGQNRIKVRVGTLAPIEITQAEAQVADREESVIIFEAALRAAEDQVRSVIGMRKDAPDWQRPIRPSDPLTLKEYNPEEQRALDAAFANRPDLEEARLSIEANENTLRARKNQRRWGLDFQGTYGNLGFDDATYSDSFQDLKDRNQTSWSAGLALNVPISNKTAIANYTRAEALLSQSQYRMAQVEQNVRLDVRSAVRAVETTLKRVKSSQTNVRLQREKLEAEQKKFENGMSTSFQVLTFQDDLSNAETRENLATADYNKALADLERAKGTILNYFGILLKGTEGGGTPSPSAALRSLWRRPADLASDPGLRLAGRVVEGVRLPADFVFTGGRLEDRNGVAPVPDWIRDAGTPAR